MATTHTDLLLHRASQYLASYGKQYLTSQPDDSHTNLKWNQAEGTLSSRKTKDGQFLLLDAAQLKLDWVNGEHHHPLGLVGRSHGEVCVWLHHIALRCGLEEYDFYLHYSLDSGALRADQVYLDYESARARQLIDYRNSAQEVCEAIRDHFDFDTEIRVWPHHFDTGGYAPLPGSDISIGFGMAIPDAVIDDYYLYVSGYNDGKPINTEQLAQLDLGEWKHGDFNGAILPIKGHSTDERINFFKQAIKELGEKHS